MIDRDGGDDFRRGGRADAPADPRPAARAAAAGRRARRSARPEPAGRVQASPRSARGAPRARAARCPAALVRGRCPAARRNRRLARALPRLLGRSPRRTRTTPRREGPTMTSEPRTATADGTVERSDDGRYVVSFDRPLGHPVPRVWAALTSPDELITWWGDADVELIEGGRFDVRWLNTDDEGNTAEMHARIAQLEPERLLVLDGDIHGTLRWELTPDGDGTRLSFRSTLD